MSNNKTNKNMVEGMNIFQRYMYFWRGANDQDSNTNGPDYIMTAIINNILEFIIGVLLYMVIIYGSDAEVGAEYSVATQLLIVLAALFILIKPLSSQIIRRVNDIGISRSYAYLFLLIFIICSFIGLFYRTVGFFIALPPHAFLAVARNKTKTKVKDRQESNDGNTKLGYGLKKADIDKSYSIGIMKPLLFICFIITFLLLSWSGAKPIRESSLAGVTSSSSGGNDDTTITKMTALMGNRRVGLNIIKDEERVQIHKDRWGKECIDQGLELLLSAGTHDCVYIKYTLKPYLRRGDCILEEQAGENLSIDIVLAKGRGWPVGKEKCEFIALLDPSSVNGSIIKNGITGRLEIYPGDYGDVLFYD